MNLKSFFEELRRRNVYKVAVAYTVVGWLLIQVATQVFPFFEIPDWAVRLIVLAIVIGFPIALIIAWAFELTPEGLKRTADVEEAPARPRKNHAWIWVVLGASALSVALFFVGRFTARPAPDAAGTPEKSIAVLPFANLSEDKANAYFADGIQDEILTRLAKIAELKVISRTSTKQYASQPGNLSEIAQQLGVAHILEGSVQKAGDSVRVNVQLIKAAGDSHLWAETYDRKLTDIFAVETEVAQRIADSLEAKLTGREKAAINYVGTKIPAAYDAYLRGIALRNSLKREDQDRVIKYCREAVTLDPNYAAAWAELAYAEGLKYIQGDRSQAQKALVREAAGNALRLDPDRGSGHAAMGLYRYYCLQEYDEALVELEQARVQAPNDAFIILAIGLVKRRQGKLDESIELQLQAARLDPLNQDIWTNLAFTYRGMRKLTEARAMFDRALAIAPGDSAILERRADTYLVEGDLETAGRLYAELQPQFMGDGYDGIFVVLELQRRYDEAIARLSADLARQAAPTLDQFAFAHLILGAFHVEAGRAREAKPLLLQAEKELQALQEQGDASPGVVAGLLEAKALLGQREEVERMAPEFIAREAKDRWAGPRAAQNAARAYVLVGNHERALALLERLLVEPSGDSWTPALLRLDPVWDPIRDNPRFQKLANAKL